MNYTLDLGHAKIPVCGTIENACAGDYYTPSYEGEFVIDDAMEFEDGEPTGKILNLDYIEQRINEDLSAETIIVSDLECIYKNKGKRFKHEGETFFARITDGELEYISMDYASGSVHIPLWMITKEFKQLILKNI